LAEAAKGRDESSKRKALLPDLTLTGQLNERDNQAYTYSESMGREGRNPVPGGGPTVNNWGGATERTKLEYEMEMSWSPTDAAGALYKARSAKNDRMKSHYQRVRKVQKLIEKVDGAFYRMLSLQESVRLARRLTRLRSEIASRTEQARREKPLTTSSDYELTQEALITARKQRSRLVHKLEKQRNILATAMQLSPDYCVDGGFRVVGKVAPPCYRAKLSEMEMTGVKSRPEAYEAGLNYFNSVNDLKRTMVKLLPTVKGFWKFNRINSKYYLNKDWREVGVLVDFDLLSWLSKLDDHKGAKSTAAKTYKEMGSVALAIASEVRVAALTYFEAVGGLKNADDSVAWRRRHLREKQKRHDNSIETKLAVMKAEAALLRQQIERTNAVGEANATLAELQAEMGTSYNEPHPPD